VGTAQRRRQRALAELCRIYWRPLFCVLCQRGFQRADAEDLTQGFLLHFIRSGALARAHPSKGRFRDFLVSALDHYLINLHARAQALKRGGDVVRVSLDAPAIAEAEALGGRLSGSGPDLPCDRAWVARLLRSVLDDLESRYVRSGREQIFRLLKPRLIGDGDGPQPYRKLALRLGRSPMNLRKDLERMRAQFREVLRQELQERVGPDGVDEELENLRAMLRRSSGIL
jgi:RNA polymerase sigma-70 factor (ECF subfamily)